MKTRELKILKFKTLFESPETAAGGAEKEDKEPKGGSFVEASARAAYLGRSITKTSDDFRKLPLQDLIVADKKAGQTFKHARVGSRYSHGMSEELNVAPPRRKTVGFKENGANAAVSDFIAVEDVESNKSLFERGTEGLELHKSIVKE